MTKNEIAALQYPGGYVLFALKKRIRKSKKLNTSSRQQVFSKLQAGKQNDVASTDQKLVDTVNRGGLWKISSVVEQIFTIAELCFKEKLCGRHVTKVDREDMVYRMRSLLSGCALLSWKSKNVSVDILQKYWWCFLLLVDFLVLQKMI